MTNNIVQNQLLVSHFFILDSLFFLFTKKKKKGVARRAWSGNDNAEFTIRRTMEAEPTLRVTLPNHASDDLLDKLII